MEGTPVICTVVEVSCKGIDQDCLWMNLYKRYCTVRWHGSRMSIYLSLGLGIVNSADDRTFLKCP